MEKQIPDFLYEDHTFIPTLNYLANNFTENLDIVNGNFSVTEIFILYDYKDNFLIFKNGFTKI